MKKSWLILVVLAIAILAVAICSVKAGGEKWENAHSITVYNTNTDMEIYHAEAEEPFTVCLSNNGSLRIDFSNGDTDFVYMNDALAFVID